MLIYKKVKIERKNLPPEIDSKTFKELWISALEDKASDLTTLLSYLKPFFKKLEKQILTLTNLDYTFMSICSFVSKDPKESYKKIKKWKKNSDSIMSDLQFCFIKRVREINKIPRKATPLMVEYFFITDYKYELSKFIRKQKYNISIPIPEPYLTNQITIDFKNNWYNYLYSLYMQGYTNTEISKITKLSRKTIIKEGAKLCQCLKHKL